MKNINWIFTLIIKVVSLHCSAQEWNYPYQHIGKEDGLPSNTVYCITSDKNNFIWIGTDAGLVKYDGVNFKIFTTKEGLPSNDVFEVVCDKFNRIWVTSMKNVVAFVERDSVNIPNNPQNKLLTNPKIVKSNDGETWIRTSNFYLLKVVENGLSLASSVNLKSQENFVYVQAENKFYFLSRSYVIRFDKINKTTSLYKPNFKTPVAMLLLDSSFCYYVDIYGNLHMANSKSFLDRGFIPGNAHFKISKIGNHLWYPSRVGFASVDLINHKKRKMFFNGVQASNFHLDNLNQLWFCTLDKGIFKLVNDHIVLPIRNSNLVAISIQGSLIYLGLNNGHVLIIDKSGKLVKKIYPKFPAMVNIKVWKLLKYKGRIYVCTDRGLMVIHNNLKNVSYIKNRTTSFKGISILGDTAIILNNVGISFYNLRRYMWIDSIINYKRFYSCINYQGKMLFGSQDSIYQLNESLIPFSLNKPFDYRAMDLDVHDSLLIATTAERGIFIIKDHTVLKNLNSENGMVTNNCNNTTIYKNTLYTATNHGIHIYDLSKDSLSYLFESDGLASNNVTDLVIDADTIYAATENGLSVIPLSALRPRKPFPCFLQPIACSKDTFWNTPDTVVTRTDQEVFATLNGLSFTSKIPVRFFYRIREQDSIYKETREQNLELRFEKPGYHTFEAYAVNGDLQKSEFVTLTVFVDPYFYQTIWFKILLVIFSLGLLGTTYYVLFYFARKRSKSKHETANKMHVLELTAWRSTVHPHFLFNAMNTMLGLLQNSNFDSANQYIFEFSKMLRKTIDQSGKIMVTIEEEENYLTNYLEFEKAKRNGNLNYEIVIDNTSVRDFFIPSMVIQPILENALKHGLKPRKKGKIRIEFYINGDIMFTVIKDNGIGFDPELGKAKAGSKGLKLIYDKLNIVEKVLKTKIPLDFKNLSDHKGNIIGTQTVFQFPLLKDISHIPGLLPQQDEKAYP